MGSDGGRAVDGCLTAVMTILVLIVLLWGGLWWWFAETSDANEAEARASLRTAVESARARLADSAADGTLLGTEIDRVLGKTPSETRRQGRGVTITAALHGAGPGWLAGGTTASGCYRFRAEPPAVRVREVPYDACTRLPSAPYRAPETVARDITAELRAALTDGGLDAVRAAPVWRTRGVGIQNQETDRGHLTALVWLSRNAGDKDCYEFRVRVRPASVTDRKLTDQGCYRMDREQLAREEAAARARLDAAARKIAQRLHRAVADGGATDAELRDALALPKTGPMGQPAVHDPVAVPLGIDRSATAVILDARVGTLDQGGTDQGCYEFRVRPGARTVTRRATGTDCFSR
ncbi:hypothetical protein [Streptomyces sp. S.PNR 29]|uniref:hypothetical protein n=1 Tax=Streptomyces sp. S.PNR 29 TaxID=2973805 RepID=UPI0025B1FB51|nr:hypothetical protein [Streptomyces sp. S.PNR 29]MDN0198519.1 hypothetical protein [Streptomyces sp. S.PNR 29]